MCRNTISANRSVADHELREVHLPGIFKPGKLDNAESVADLLAGKFRILKLIVMRTIYGKGSQVW
jgi:hypothetical protein